MEHTTKSVLSPKEAAEYLGVSTQTLARLRRDKQPPTFFKIGGQYRYTKSALDSVKGTNQ